MSELFSVFVLFCLGYECMAIVAKAVFHMLAKKAHLFCKNCRLCAINTQNVDKCSALKH